MQSPNIGIGIRGSLLDCPVEVQIRDQNGALSWAGILQVRQKGIGDLLELIDADLMESDEIVRALVDVVDDIIGTISFDMEIRHSSGMTSYELEIDHLRVRIVATPVSSAFAVQLSDGSAVSESGSVKWLLNTLQIVRNTLGIRDLLLVYRKKPGIRITDLTGAKSAAKVPPALSRFKWLAYGSFAFPEDSVAGNAIEQILGVSRFDGYLGLDPFKNNYLVCLAFGKIDNELFSSDQLYLRVGFEETTPSFAFKGSFIFKFIPEVTFSADCTISATSFTLAASFNAENRINIPIIPGLSIAEGGLLAGITEGSPTFGLYATMYIRELMIFGAIMVSVKGDVPVPLLVSGAIDPVSLPNLFRNLTGFDIDGLDALDVLSLDRLREISLPDGFTPDILKKHDTYNLAALFNKAVADTSLNLDPERIHIRTLETGYALVDQARMRHYFVDTKGSVSLQSQFYLSIQPTAIPFGEYTIEPGLFFCGALEIFGKRFEALFSFRVNDGVLAYARLDPLDFRAGSFTIFSLTASHDTSKDPRPIGSGGLADQFIPAHPTGVVFFLTASRKEVCFYLSGHVELLGLIKLDARLVYAARILSLHTDCTLWGVRVVLQLDISWKNLLKSRFGFVLIIDTKELTQLLKAVTRAIDQAIEALKTTVSRAQKELDNAQTRVNTLHGEITDMDRRIANCKSAVNRAKWWKKVAVAIAMGAQIAVYEVAKAGIWTAIGVATAALQLAKVAVNAFGALGTGLLELVNQTIRAATSLLYLHSAKIIADISPQHQKFQAAISFRALGKEYQLSAAASLNLLQGDLIGFLSKELLSLLGPDLNNVAKGKPPSLKATPPKNLSLIRKSSATFRSRITPSAEIDEIPPIENAAQEMKRASEILALLEQRYQETFNEDLAEFTQFNSNFDSALQHSSNSLTMASKTAGTKTYAKLLEKVSGLDRSSLSTTRKNKVLNALNELSEKLDAQKFVKKAIGATVKARKIVAGEMKVPYAKQRRTAPPRSDMNPEERMVNFLTEFEAEIHARYGEAATGYINLSLENTLSRTFAQAHKKLGSRPPKPPVQPQSAAQYRRYGHTEQTRKHTEYRQRL